MMTMDEIQKLAKQKAKEILKDLRENYKMSYSQRGLFADSLRAELKRQRRKG